MATAQPLHGYDQPHQFEPLLPQKELDGLALRSREAVERALQLQGSAHEATAHACVSWCGR